MPAGALDHKVNFADFACLVVPRIRPESNKLLRDHVLVEAAEVGGFHIKIDGACRAAGISRCEHSCIRLV